MSADLDLEKPWMEGLRWSSDGLITAIAQDAETGRVLMVAWMNHEALQRTADSGEAVYWSRSRNRLWRKGEESGHVQKVLSIRTDCDGDVILLSVDPVCGLSCHTGRTSCFFHELRDGRWQAVEPVVKDPREIYRK